MKVVEVDGTGGSDSLAQAEPSIPDHSPSVPDTYPDRIPDRIPDRFPDFCPRTISRLIP